MKTYLQFTINGIQSTHDLEYFGKLGTLNLPRHFDLIYNNDEVEISNRFPKHGENKKEILNIKDLGEFYYIDTLQNNKKRNKVSFTILKLSNMEYDNIKKFEHFQIKEIYVIEGFEVVKYYCLNYAPKGDLYMIWIDEKNNILGAQKELKRNFGFNKSIFINKIDALEKLMYLLSNYSDKIIDEIGSYINGITESGCMK